MKSSLISRRSLIHRSAALALTLWVGRGLAQTKWASGMQLAVTFELVAGSGNYKRPYVAVWLENAQGLPVRTLALWYEQGRGQRWLGELRRWYSRGDLQSTVSGPTRMPGKYALAWDGKDDKGALVNQGDYYVCVEMAREHGPYELFREKISVSSSAFNKSYTPDGEVKGVSLAYGKSS